MGFPDVGDDEVVFTDADVAALARVTELLDEGLLDLGTAVQLGRAMGRTTARLADWQMEAFTERTGDAAEQVPLQVARPPRGAPAGHSGGGPGSGARPRRRRSSASCSR